MTYRNVDGAHASLYLEGYISLNVTEVEFACANTRHYSDSCVALVHV